jgi:hypothetical protein
VAAGGATGLLEVVEYRGDYLDTGTPATYLAANLHAAGGGNLIDPTAIVSAPVERAVIGAGRSWPSGDRAVVWPGGRSRPASCSRRDPGP